MSRGKLQASLNQPATAYAESGLVRLRRSGGILRDSQNWPNTGPESTTGRVAGGALEVRSCDGTPAALRGHASSADTGED